MASPEVIKIPFNSNAITPAPTSAPAINISMRNETKSWHVVDVWKVSVTTFVLILISVRPFDYFSYLCNEDEDVQKAKFKAILNFYKKIKKIIAKEQTDKTIDYRTKLKINK
jgi:hypothetical protein